ncbi:MAG TPA: O-antigen ligase domain-containing protein, partial [Phycisphaerales bacterium]|nr:O-antigen ligase domain-containing protein [Phycisphaerales bacterium]
MSRRISEAFLLLLWCLPLIAMVGLYLDFSDSNPLVLLKPGLFDSNRTLLLVLAISAFVASLPAKPRLNPLSVTTCLFLTWVFLSSAAGGKLFDALLFSQTWLAAVLIFLCTVKLYPRNFCMKRKLGLFHGPVTGVAVLSLLPMVFNDDVIRVTGPFLLANVYSNWLLLLLPLLLQDLLLGDKRYLPVSLITCGLTLASLALTYSRACWILTLTTLGIVTLLAQSVGWKRVLAWALTLLGLAALLLSLRDQLGGPGFIACWAVATQLPAFFECAFFRRSKSPQLRCLQAMALAGLVVLMVGHSKTATDLGHNAKSRMDNLVQFDNSTKSRLEFWEAALDIANDHPILGTGPDGFSDYYPQHQKHYYYYSDSPHNSFLELASELGWVGATLFLLGLAALARRVAGQRTLSITQSFALVGFGAGLVQAQVDVTYQFAFV